MNKWPNWTSYAAMSALLLQFEQGAFAQDGTQCPPASGVSVQHTPLNVNPDGTAGSYTPGDHGFTYIANGLNLYENRTIIGCSGTMSRRCRQLFLQAEAQDFGPGSPTFCVYAIEVVGYTPGTEAPGCDPRRPYRRLLGDGRGRPRPGPPIANVTGTQSPTYVSTTSLQHTVGGRRVYLDSATIPVLVAPRDELLGAVAWLRLGDRSTFAIFGDSGPRLGEGSIALHQYLLYGALQPPQPIGPIPVSERCGRLERSIRAPFKASPDPGDECRAGRAYTSVSDIRGYANIDDPVDVVILEEVRLPRNSNVIPTEVTPRALEQIAAEAGYTSSRLAGLADCSRRALPRR